MNKLLTYYLFFLGSILTSSYQKIPEKGVPLLQNFKPAEYNHQGKIWSIDTAPNGIVYMASDKSLLEYDGEKWKNYKGSDGITRSILVDNDSLIYTGSDLDFGVWKKNEYQDFNYTSLYPFKEDLNEINEEFWSVHSVNGSIFFISASNIYVYKDKNLTKIPAPNKIRSSFVVSDTLYFVDEIDGLYQLKDLAPKHLFHFNKNASLEIVGIYESNDVMVFVTKNTGLFQYISGELKPINNKLSRDLKAASVFSFETISDTHIAFGTILKGLFISDRDGNIVQYINKNKGLQNNTILSLHHSSSGKLWMGMDYGVSFLDLSNEYTFFYDYRGNFGTGYSAVLKDDTFYLGTNQGLYKSKWEDLNNRTESNNLELVKGTEGQVWTLKNIEDQIWVGHDRGLFKLKNNKLSRISSQQGFWTIQSYKKYLLAGTYNGISIFEKKDNEWVFKKKMELILGSCNQLLIDGENTLWINIPNYGIVRALLDEDLNPIERKTYFAKEFKGNDPNLIKDDSGIQVVTDEFNYEYKAGSNDFVVKEPHKVKREVADLLVNNARSVQLNSGFEFYPVYNGFALKDLSINDLQQTSSFKLIFRSVEAFNNNEKIIAYDGKEISYQFNNIRIKSIVPNKKDVLYQFRMFPSDAWSNWSTENAFELIGLEHGKHTLSARAKVNGVVTSIETISIRIQAPWYQTFYAYVFYFLVIVLLVYLFYLWRWISMKKLKKGLLIKQQNSLREQAEKYQQKLKRIEEEKLQAEYEQLKAQLKSKTIELATKAKENEEVNKVLQTLKEKIEKLEENPDSLKSRSAEIKKILASYINEEDNTFEIQMDELHQEFFKKLRKDFPELTRYDLRLCAYLKLGFNSKEIANLLNIMPSSVYISRSRLRKKLDLDSDRDLHSYLNSI